MTESGKHACPWRSGWGNGLTGPTTAAIAGPTVAGREWGFHPVSAGMETIAICPNQADAQGQQIAGSGKKHADLLASAPDLLEACLQALVHIEGDEATHGRNFAAGNVLRAAIAKTEGGRT